ncbi:hypothetical protein DVH24_027517 [Malus domestica]|uniref:RNase H type-1 domain-containing protein n=1 Tax=Malus domestica TaxID=3750 RepID=A0A498H968_MALDO|nr:hypothetical protein DVH24_027517 [Malus domestica]
MKESDGASKFGEGTSIALLEKFVRFLANHESLPSKDKQASSLAQESFDPVLVLVWSIWKEHNEFVWKGTFLHQMEVHCKNQKWLQEYQKWHRKTKCSSNVVAVVTWNKPGNGWLKCNFDGA